MRSVRVVGSSPATTSASVTSSRTRR
jgi:hypothetical protein